MAGDEAASQYLDEIAISRRIEVCLQTVLLFIKSFLCDFQVVDNFVILNIMVCFLFVEELGFLD